MLSSRLLARARLCAYLASRLIALCVGHSRRENGVAAPPPGTSPGALYFRPLLPIAEFARHLLEQSLFVWRQARQPLPGDLVQHAIELLRLRIAPSRFGA